MYGAIIEYNDSKLCVIYIHNYLKYILQIVLSIFSIFTKKKV